MKNTILKFSLTALAALTLAACGSSGGSGDSATDNGQNQINSTTPSNNNPVQVSSNRTGAVLVATGEDNNANVKRVNLTDYNLETLFIDGKTVRIAPPSNGGTIFSGGWTKYGAGVTFNGYKFPNTVSVCCGKYTDVRMGAIGSTGPGQEDILFYNGNPTNSMPSSGVASYAGDSIITADTDKLPDEDYVKGSSTFTADFGNKKLTGTISAANVDVVKVDASISVNSFTGTAKSDLLNSQGTAEGKFYGENAKELGGLAKANDNSWGAAFAAKK